MRATEYKAIRKAGVKAFAVFPADVERDLPWSIDNANKQANVRACPTGLVRAEIVKDDVTWFEAFTLGCGDTEYKRQRRNGVLVEILLEDFRRHLGGKVTLKALGELPRTEIIGKGSARVVQIVISKSAIMAPWGEYEMIEAERAKAKEERVEREERLSAAVEAIGARRGGFTEVTGKCGEDGKQLAPEDYDYHATIEWRTQDRGAYLQGDVVLSLDRAEEIAALLAKP